VVHRSATIPGAGWREFSGAYYKLEKYRDIKFDDFEMWLCDVTAYVFQGKFPDIIYFKVVEVS